MMVSCARVGLPVAARRAPCVVLRAESCAWRLRVSTPMGSNTSTSSTSAAFASAAVPRMVTNAAAATAADGEQEGAADGAALRAGGDPTRSVGPGCNPSACQQLLQDTKPVFFPLLKCGSSRAMRHEHCRPERRPTYVHSRSAQQQYGMRRRTTDTKGCIPLSTSSVCGVTTFGAGLGVRLR